MGRPHFLRAAAARVALGLLVAARTPGPASAAEDLPVTTSWSCYGSVDDLEKARLQLGAITLRDFTVDTPGTWQSAWRRGFSDQEYPTLSHSVSLHFQALTSDSRQAIADVQMAAFDDRNSLLFIVDVRSPTLFRGQVADAMQNAVVEPGMEKSAKRICILPRAAEIR